MRRVFRPQRPLSQLPANAKDHRPHRLQEHHGDDLRWNDRQGDAQALVDGGRRPRAHRCAAALRSGTILYRWRRILLERPLHGAASVCWRAKSSELWCAHRGGHCRGHHTGSVAMPASRSRGLRIESLQIPPHRPSILSTRASGSRRALRARFIPSSRRRAFRAFSIDDAAASREADGASARSGHGHMPRPIDEPPPGRA